MSIEPPTSVPSGRRSACLWSAARRIATATATLALSVSGVVALGSAAQAETYAWDQPVVTVKSTVSSSWGVARAVRQWNSDLAPGQPRLVIRNSAVDPDVLIQSVREPGHWWTGLTSGSACGDVITDIEIDLNLATIYQSKYRDDGTFRVAKEWTTSHELGHALGLDHTQVRRSVMSYSNPWRQTAGMPSDYDFHQLALIYALPTLPAPDRALAPRE